MRIHGYDLLAIIGFSHFDLSLPFMEMKKSASRAPVTTNYKARQ